MVTVSVSTYVTAAYLAAISSIAAAFRVSNAWTIMTDYSLTKYSIIISVIYTHFNFNMDKLVLLLTWT